MFSWARNLTHFEHAGPFMPLRGGIHGGAKRGYQLLKLMEHEYTN